MWKDFLENVLKVVQNHTYEGETAGVESWLKNHFEKMNLKWVEPLTIFTHKVWNQICGGIVFNDNDQDGYIQTIMNEPWW